MKYYVLDSKAESDECLENCHNACINNIPSGDYKSQTTAWAEEQQRVTDNKYIVPVCSTLGTFGYNIETATSEWFPEIS